MYNLAQIINGVTLCHVVIKDLLHNAMQLKPECHFILSFLCNKAVKATVLDFISQ